MFAKTIIDSDAFLDMPLSSQVLYFHLSMRADDEGFINNPKKIQRMVGCNDDDMKLLIAKSFVIYFESGIIVIKHWKMHNYIRKDRLNETVYQEEKSSLFEKRNGVYTLDQQEAFIKIPEPKEEMPIESHCDNEEVLTEQHFEAECQPHVSHLSTTCQSDDNQVTDNCQPNDGIGKVRLGKVSIGKDSTKKTYTPSKMDVEEIWTLYPLKQGRASAIKKIPQLLKTYGIEQMERCINRYVAYVDKRRSIDFPDLKYKNGSTFFNAGYADFLDDNYDESMLDIKPVKNNKSNNYMPEMSDERRKAYEELELENEFAPALWPELDLAEEG